MSPTAEAVSTFCAAADLSELNEAVGFDALAHVSSVKPRSTRAHPERGEATDRVRPGSRSATTARGRACLRHLPTSRVILKHLKSRHGEARDIALSFNRKHQRFTPADPAQPTKRSDNGKLQTALRALDAPPGSRRRGRAVSSNADSPARRKTSKRASRLRFEVLNSFVDSSMAGLSRAELRSGSSSSATRSRGDRPSLARRHRRPSRYRSPDGIPSGRPTGTPEMLEVLRRGGLNHGPSEYRIFPFPMGK